MNADDSNKTLLWYEAVLLLSGFLILISAVAIYVWGDFTLWTTAKVFYGAGVLLFAWYA